MKKVWLMLVVFFAFAMPSVAAERYVIDPVHSNVGFSVRHLMVSNTHGKFKDFSGEIYFDEKNPEKSSAQGVIKVASIDTENAKRDGHLKGPDFFDVARYPEIRFRTTKVAHKGGDAYVVRGLLTMRGVEKEVDIPVTFLGKRTGPGGKEHIGLEATLKINRQDFGVSWNRALDQGGVVIGNDVKITLDLEAIQE